MSINAQTGDFGWALQPAKYGDGTIEARKAKAKVIFTSALTLADKTVVVGATTYTFKTTLTPAANEVLIGATSYETVRNLTAAINAGAGSGTLYGTGTVANASASAQAQDLTVVLTALATGTAGNSIVLSDDASNISTVAFSGGQASGTYSEAAMTYHHHRSADIDYDLAQDQRDMPLEVGSTNLPIGQYKAGGFVGGGATLLQRLDGVFGDLLLAALGSSSVQNNTPETGCHTHTFKIGTDPNELPWVTVRKHIPGRGTYIRAKGVKGIDNLVNALRINVPQNDIVSTRVDFIGRIPQLEDNSDVWNWGNTYETFEKVPVSCKGYFKIPTIFANEMPVTGVSIELINNLTTPREEMIVGSYFMDDMIVRSRRIQLRVVHKWNDPEMYERAYTAQANGTAWSPEVFTTKYAGGQYAFECRIESPVNIGATNTPYSLTIRAGAVTWQPVGAVQLRAGAIVMQEYVGTLIDDQTLGVPYAEYILVNGQSTAYAIPS